jgi:Domain of unknown function (DUF4389)
VISVATTASYPVHIQARLDQPLSRWLWLIKWVLVIPHYIVLLFLWIAFGAVSVIAFFAILFTGHYPRALFDFNVGVLRWNWRVTYYAYGGLGTDRYPPFTMADVPDYPARLSVDYPEQLSRGLVLIKWWLLAIPHYIITGFFVGGGTWLAGRSDDWQWGWGSGGLIAVLVLVCAIVLAFTGSYPQPLFDFIVGLNRWVLRVAGYASLMTDRYPPFRLDLGGADPDDATALEAQGTPTGLAGPAETPQGLEPPAPSTAPERSGWTPGRIVSVVAGAVIALVAVGLAIGGGAALWADRAHRDSAGYLTSPTSTFSTPGRALTSASLNIEGGGPGWAYPRSTLGDVRFRFTATDPAAQTFVGIARSSDVARYLSGVDYSTVTDFGADGTRYTRHSGGPPPNPPAAADFWVVKATGTGTQTLTWTPASGDWTILAMNADGSSPVTVRADAAGTVPALTWIAIGLLAAGLVLLAVGTIMIAIPVRRSSIA